MNEAFPVEIEKVLQEVDDNNKDYAVESDVEANDIDDF